ncbi:hypothetical protein AVEN_258997-1, partial [Araneus ventricosus]
MCADIINQFNVRTLSLSNYYYYAVTPAIEFSFPDEPPVLEEIFSDKIVYPGVSVSLKCMATGSPLPQVTWRLDSLPLPEQLRFRVGDYVTRDSRVVSYVNIT